MDSYCTQCSLQFDNKAVYNMHLSIVHKENVEINQEPTCDTFVEEPEKVPFQYQICEKAFSEKRNLNKHVSSSHENKKTFKCEICDYKKSEFESTYCNNS